MTIENADKRRASRLRLDAAMLSRSIASGQFRSLRKGVHGVDFAGVREYTPFDDARQIDWNVTARSTKTYVKLFEEDKDCQMFIVLDRSRSMFTGKDRWNTAVQASTLVALASSMHSIRVGGVIFDSEIRALTLPKTGGEFLTMLERFSSPSKMPPTNSAGTALHSALLAAISCLKSRSFIMIISDWRCAASLYEPSLASLAMRHDVLSICTVSKEDTELPCVGSVLFADAEEGREEVLLSSSPLFLRRWKTEGIRRKSSWQALCAKRGVMNASLQTGKDPLPDLMAIFKHARGTAASATASRAKAAASYTLVAKKI